MEKPPENASKIFDLKGLLKLPKRVRRWDLLLVDDHGKVMSFQHVKGLVITFLIFVLLSLSVSIVLFCLYKNTQETMVELQNTLETSREDAADMQQEMRDLMVRLAKAQSRLPKRHAQKVPKVVKKASPVIKILPPPVIPHVDTKAGNLQTTAGTQMLPPETGPEPSMMKIEVGIFDFSAEYDAELKAVRIRFIIKNINRNISEIPGYIFAVMKTDTHDQKRWFPIPTVELVTGRPNSIKAGQFFKIRNYKTVELRSKPIPGPEAFNRASILVYSTKGDLLVEKTYRVEIEVAGNVEKEPPTAVPETVPQKQDESLPEEPVAASPAVEKADPETIIPNPVQEKDSGQDPGEAEKE